MKKGIISFALLILAAYFVPCHAQQVTLQEYLIRATAYSDKGAYDQAIETYNAALKEYPDSAESYAGRAILYFAQKDFSGAKKDLDKALEIKPDMDLAYIYRSMVYMELKDYEKSLADVEKAENLGTREVGFWSTADMKQKIREHLPKEKLDEYGKKKLAESLSLLKSPDVNVRSKAAEALGETNDPSAIEPLLKIIKEDSELQVRAEAASALGHINDPRSVDALIEMLKSDNNTVFLSRVISALGELKDKKAIKPLNDALDKVTPDNRALIKFVLEQIENPPEVRPFPSAPKGKDIDSKMSAQPAGQNPGRLSGDDFFSAAVTLMSTKKDGSNWQPDTMLEIVNRMVEAGELERALEAAGLCEEGIKKQRSMAYVAICAAVIKKGEFEKAFAIARDKIGFDIYKVDALVKVAEEFYKAGQSEWALKVAGALDNEAGRGYIFLALSNLAKEKQNFAEAFELAKKMGGGWRAASSLKKAAVGFAEAGKLEQAFALTEILEKPHNRAETLLEISKVLFKTGQKEKALETLAKSLDTGERIPNNLNLDSLYADAAQAYAEFGHVEKAVEIAKKIKPDFPNQGNVFRDIALKYDTKGDFETAKAVLKNISSVYSRENALAEVNLAHNGFLRSDERLSASKDPWQKLVILVQLDGEEFARQSKKKENAELVEKLAQEKTGAATQWMFAEYYFKLGDKEKARQVLVKAEERAKDLAPSARANSLITIASSYIKFGENQKVVSLVKEAFQISEKDAIESLNRMAPDRFFPILLEAEMPEEALKIASNASALLSRGGAQLNIARYYLSKGDYEKAMEICRNIEFGYYKASLLADLGAEYAKKGKKIGALEQQFLKNISVN